MRDCFTPLPGASLVARPFVDRRSAYVVSTQRTACRIISALVAKFIFSLM